MIRRAVQSLCPVCLRRVDGVYEEIETVQGLEVRLRKTCPEHGTYATPVWRGPGFAEWVREKTPSAPPRPETAARKGCPYDCGLCPEHGQHTCTALVEVTSRCNLCCPLCFADAGKTSAGKASAEEPSLAALHARFAQLAEHAGHCNLQISGGEPTVREDLPAIIAAAGTFDFGLVQLNTNGLRLAEPGYAAKLRDAGLDSVYLQWDGLDDRVYMALRGRPCLAKKRAALESCAGVGLGVVLVMTVLAGVNDDHLGAMLRFAAAEPGVRGLHLQPAAFFGRYPGKLDVVLRLTLPEIMDGLEKQSGGQVRREHLHPPGCEHALCSCSAVYARTGGVLTRTGGNSSVPGIADTNTERAAQHAVEGARKARSFVAAHWSSGRVERSDSGKDTFARFVAAAGEEQRFTLSCMAFQDALSVDLDRVRGCCIHVSTPDGRRVPFCLYNLTAIGGEPLYRGC